LVLPLEYGSKVQARPCESAVNAGMYTDEMVLENLAAVRRKIDLGLA
jgi:hypothetical protein